MSATQTFETWYDSRPIYKGLSLDPRAKSHLIVTEDDGASAVLEAFAKQGSVLPRTILLQFSKAGSQDGSSSNLAALGVADYRTTTTREELFAHLDEVLETANMGLRLYVAGSESFIGEVIARAATFGMVPDSVIAERCGSLARRVQCVHCKHVTNDVTASPYECPGCGLHLLVRDHYSRRLAAFQGVRIDAEAPGEVPAAEEIVQ